MMTRRNFFSRLAAGVAGAALAVHLEFGELVPIFPKEKWYYLIEETLPVCGAIKDDERVIVRFAAQAMFVRHIRWITEDDLPALGLKHEDFADRWEELPNGKDTLILP